MVNILPPRHNFASAFGEGLAENLSQVPEQLSDVLSAYQQRKRNEQEQDVLARVSSGEDVPIEERKSLTIPTQLKLAEISQKRESAQQKKRIAGNIKKSLENAGYPAETAQLWQDQYEASDSLVGQSDVVKHVDDLLKRSPKGKGLTEEEKAQPVIEPINIPGLENIDFNLNFPPIEQPLKYTPAELIKHENANREINSKNYETITDNLFGLDEDFRDISHLKELNESGDLPTAFAKWNVDWETGDLRVPALAGTAAEDYVKTLYRLLRNAKKQFPGRVTNFDLEQYKKQFPTLANSPEGRKVLAESLQLANRIAYLKDETMKAAIDHYGSGADPQKIRQYATENYRKLKGQLENELKILNSKRENLYKQKEIENKTFEELPSASKYSGKRIVDEETGQTYQSNGKEWIKI